MSTITLNGTAAASNPAAQRSKADALRIAALALLSIRFIQGFIYWGGGSRRFIYAPAKLDPNAASWMANKFQSGFFAGRCPTQRSPPSGGGRFRSNMGSSFSSRADSAIGSYPRIILAGQSSCVVFLPFQRGASL